MNNVDDGMKLRKISVRIPETIYLAAQAWFNQYNAAHKDQGCQRLIFSDVVRFGLESFISSFAPKKFNLPK